MTRRRFYAPPSCFAPDGASLVLPVEESRHLCDVLRLRAGDEAFVFDGEGAEFRCVVRDVGGRKARKQTEATALEVCERVEPLRPESPLNLTLAVALLKGEKFDLVVQKATELGVTFIVPISTKRSDVRPRDGREESLGVKRVERWRRLALEAAKQSGRARVPAIEAPVELARLFEAEPEEGELLLMFSERDGRPLAAIACEKAEAPSELTALVGPEGGWEMEEIDAARERGWEVVTLGGRTLRAETAAITVCVLLQHIYGDLR